MSKTSNSQKVIEAEANLQIAKMLEGISNLKASLELFDRSVNVGWNSSPEKAITTIFDPILKLKDLMLSAYITKRNCALTENIKLVDDITKGIQLKARYEMRIKELETALEVAQSNNVELEKMLNEFKLSFKSIIDKLIEDKVDKEVVENFMMKYSNNIMEKSINFAVKEVVKKILNDKRCQTEEMPF